MNNIPRLVYGNDFTIKIFMKEMVDGEIVAYDLSYCTDVQVQMYCSKHKTMFELPYTLDEQDSSIINAEIDYRLTHPNTMYGFVVSGYDEQGMHFQWCQRPSEGIMIVEGSSGAYLDPSIDKTIDISARIGFDVDISGVVQADWNVNDSEQPGYIKNKPTIPTKTSDLTNDSDFVDETDLATKQDTLVSGTNIKTINNQSILGSGNIEIEPSVQSDWNQTNSSQPDYIKNKPDLDEKQDLLISGTNIKTINHKSILGSGNINIEGGGGGGGSQVQADWNQTDDTEPDYIWNKPDLATVATSGSYNDLSNKPTIPTKTSDLTNDSDFVDATDLATKQDTLVSGTNIKTINNQSILGSGNIEIQAGTDQQQADWNENDNTKVDYIKNKPDLSIYAQSSSLATVATSGDYDDLSNKPTIPAAQVQSDYNQSDSSAVDYIKNKPDLSIYAQSSSLATVATSGDYDDLSNKPNIPTKTSDLTNDSDFVDATDLATKQDTLVSGTNIKTINNQSILGSGDIEIEPSVQPDWEQDDDQQPDYIKNKPEFEEPKVMFVEEMPSTQEEDTIYVESPVYDFKTTTIDIVNEAPSSVEDDKIVIVSNPIQLKTINNQEIVGEGNIKIQTGDIIYENEYFTITSLEDNNIIGWETTNNQSRKTINVSTDYGQTWTSYTSIENGVQIATLNAGDKLFVKGSENSYGDVVNVSGRTYSYFTSTKKFNVSGNIMSMLYGDDFVGQTVLPTYNYGIFLCLFRDCIKLISAENLILPATALKNFCYVSMFSGCTSLTTAPELPATTLAHSCYNNMFTDCIGLTIAPKLPATTLADYCYHSMFYGCTKIDFIKLNATSSAPFSFNTWLGGVNSTGTIIKPSSLVLPTYSTSGIPTGWNAYTEQEYKPIRVKDNVITSSTSGLKIEVVSALPASPDNNTIYIIQ